MFTHYLKVMEAERIESVLDVEFYREFMASLVKQLGVSELELMLYLPLLSLRFFYSSRGCLMEFTDFYCFSRAGESYLLKLGRPDVISENYLSTLLCCI